MCMNCIRIYKTSDFASVITAPIYIAGDTSLVDEETSYNMWALEIDDQLVQKIRIVDLEQFIVELLKQRQQQLLDVHSVMPVTFYMWFDHQALQLRFNFLSGDVYDLPFGCDVHVVDSPASILQSFIDAALQNAVDGEAVEFCESSDNYDDNDDFVVNVYKKVLQT